jgi:hypothetical protein
VRAVEPAAAWGGPHATAFARVRLLGTPGSAIPPDAGEQIERNRLVPAGGSPDDAHFTDVYAGVRRAGPEPPPPS